MRKSGKSKPYPSVPLLHQGYRNNLYSLTVQLNSHKEPNAIKDLSEKGVKGMNLNLNTLTLFMTILLFKSISKEQIYLKKQLTTKSLLILISQKQIVLLTIIFPRYYFIVFSILLHK